MNKAIRLLVVSVMAVVPFLQPASLVEASLDQRNDVATNTSTILSNKEISKFDKYVRVKNNKFILNLPTNNNFSSQEIKAVQQMIDNTNEDVSANDKKINATTKEVTATSPSNNNLKFGISLYASRKKATKKHYTYKLFWWGTRYYFRSNAAVYQMDHELDGYMTALAITGTLAAVVSSGAATAVSGSVAAYLNKVKSDLDYMNNMHPHSYLYMDVNKTGFYKIKTFK
ncbi:hypothetical protein BTI72_05155 [Lactobacillus delbrueckii subsp. bulgaricus]|nr:hypothetical protein [Lactobacillus delbrueckii subsp. bulgaricus]